MKFTEALKVLQKAPRENQLFEVGLACGFTPLHLQTFLAAHLVERLPARSIRIRTGLYGDPAGTLEGGLEGCHAVALALEWPDLDPRLGFREAGAWGPAAVSDVVSSARKKLDRILRSLQRLPDGMPAAICLPTLPLPPLFTPPGWQAGPAEIALQHSLLEFGAASAACPGVSIVNSTRLAEDSAPAERYDIKSDLLTGLPYTMRHAGAVGRALALLIAPPPPKKGLITDLDDTLWFGLVGEVGPENVAWDLTSHHQLHGLYQKLLSALAEEGVLVGIASKNDPDVVERALRREDLLLRADRVFPIEVSWHAKSGAAGRILQTWNIGADSVVFVDDSPMELAEVAAAHPGIECILFPRDDYAAGHALLRRLRDLFGKAGVSDEDAIRLDSIRQGAAFRELDAGGSASESFLEQADAVVTFDFDGVAEDGRALELVNKTNQFNLNGVRLGEAEWKQRLARPGAVAATVAYRDRFGPLGKIAVVQGRCAGGVLRIETWVMSCRAFARRIEHQCLRTLFDRLGVAEIHFDFAPTPKNSPLREFASMIAGAPPSGPFAISREQFALHCPPLYHRVTELERVHSHG